MVKTAIVVNGTENKNLYPAFVMGSSACSLDDDVVIFFTPSAAPKCIKGELEKIKAKGMPDMEDLLEGVVELGGKMMLCELGLKVHDINEEDIRDEIEIVGMATFLMAIKDATITYTF